MPRKSYSAKSLPKNDSSLRDGSLRKHDAIARDIGVQILSGRYKPGDLLDREVDASERLQVSRSAYREAIKTLTAKGLIHSRKKAGTLVRNTEDWHLLDPDVLSWIFELDLKKQPNETLLDNLFEFRKIVEPEATALAASRRTPSHLSCMQHALASLSQGKVTSKARQFFILEFHTVLLRASGNAFLINFGSGIAAAITWATAFKQRDNRLLRDSIPYYQCIYSSIKVSNPQAAREAMQALIKFDFVDAADTRDVR